jgi:hypothetical protein
MPPGQASPQGDSLFDDEFAANLHRESGGYGAMPGKGNQSDVEQQAAGYGKLKAGMCSFGTSAVTNLLMFVLLPWAMFTIVMWPFALGYHQFAVFAWMLFGCLTSASVGLVYGSFTPWGNPKLYWRWLGMLCILACVLGMVLGLYDYYKYGQGYYVYQASRPYSEVAPSENPGAYLDAGTIDFTPEAAIDTSRSVGYKERGSMFCVAPIIDTTQLAMPKAQAGGTPKVGFWAAGIDCCGPRGAFWCGPLLESKVHGGLVVRDTTSFAQKVVPSYMRAVAEASASYEIEAPKDAVLVLWSALAPEDVGLDIWSQCTAFYSRAVSTYIVVLFAVVVFGALIYDASQGKAKGRPIYNNKR